MAVGDANVRGVRIANLATAQVSQPSGTLDGVTPFAEPRVVDLGSTVQIRNMLADFTVRRTTNVDPFLYSIQSQHNVKPGSFVSATAYWPGLGEDPNKWVFKVATPGPFGDPQEWNIFMEYTKPPVDTRNTEFHLEDTGLCGPFVTGPTGLLYDGHFATMNLVGGLPGTISLLLNQDYFFRWWAQKVSA